MIIAGIDEAGRGPCFGPMTMTIAAIEKEDEPKLKTLGVRDSKELTPKKREALFPQVKETLLEHHTVVIGPIEINDMMVRYSLNEIEEIKIAELIAKLKCKVDTVYIDSPETNCKKFEEKVRKFMEKKDSHVKLVAENKADSKYLIVGAASILAKVTRDSEIEKIKEKFGNIGSGYPSDPSTVAYLEKYVTEHKKLPPFSRIFWANCKLALDRMNSKQQKLFEELK
ncbi:MAG: ribonuclease HII [archaeon]